MSQTISNSPKIHFLQNKEGKFHNIKFKETHESFIHASYEKDIKVLKSLLQFEKYSDCTIITITEEDFMQEMATLTTDLVIAGEYFSSLLRKVSVKIPTISQVNKSIYNRSKMLLEELKPFVKMHEMFLEAKEDTTDDVSGHYSGYITEVSKTKMYQTAEVTAILKAYQYDRASLLGIAKKVLRNNNHDLTY